MYTCLRYAACGFFLPNDDFFKWKPVENIYTYYTIIRQARTSIFYILYFIHTDTNRNF